MMVSKRSSKGKPVKLRCLIANVASDSSAFPQRGAGRALNVALKYGGIRRYEFFVLQLRLKV